MTKISDEVAYDGNSRLLYFFTKEGSERIRCAVSKAALAALEDDALAGPHAMATTYRRNRQRIRAAAIRKYRQCQLEDGEVVVRMSDLAE